METTAAVEYHRGNTCETVFLDICKRLAQGEVLIDICKDESMPTTPGFLDWLADNPTYYERYVRARNCQGHHYFEQIIKLNDEIDNFNHQAIGKRIDTMKWVCGKLNGHYSDRPQTVVDQSQHVHVQELKSAQVDESNRLMAAAARRRLPKSANPS